MPYSTENHAVFNRLYKANTNEPIGDWNDSDSDNNWPAPGDPWIGGGKIIPAEPSWVYVFHFEQPVSARFLRCSFEQAQAVAPATGYIGRVMVNSFEVYNTRP